MAKFDETKSMAFEYVLGTLRGAERKAFVEQLGRSQELANEVQFWENNLAALSQEITPVPPKLDTFARIQAQIQHRHQPTVEPEVNRFWQRLLPWQLATSVAFALFFAVCILFYNAGLQSTGLNTDYVAVLVDEQDQPVLTALAASASGKLWLKWENWNAPQDRSLQLWAQSRRDGEVRPLLVFDGSQPRAEIQLDEATVRLIKDSSHLIITEEELGGSAIDEPSDLVVAKGVCIRLNDPSGRA